MRLRTCAAIVWLGASSHAVALAGESGPHEVRIEVAPLHELALDGGDVHLTVGGSAPAHDTSASIRWTTSAAGHKVVVATDSPDSRFRLSVDPQHVRGGISAGEVALSPIAQELVYGVSVGGATLRFSAEAVPGTGAAVDAQRVTCTLVDG